jgi:hypothetical protein
VVSGGGITACGCVVACASRIRNDENNVKINTAKIDKLTKIFKLRGLESCVIYISIYQ